MYYETEMMDILLCFRIRRAGYPIRHSFNIFASRYHMLVIGLGDLVSRSPKEATKIIALNAISDSDWQIGHNKIFLKVNMIVATCCCCY